MSHKSEGTPGPCTVAVVGYGFSGTMVAVHLARLGDRAPRIALFEKSDRPARGVA